MPRNSTNLSSHWTASISSAARESSPSSDREDRFETWLTLELILSTQDRFGRPAVDFVRYLSDRFCATGELLDAGGGETVGETMTRLVFLDTEF